MSSDIDEFGRRKRKRRKVRVMREFDLHEISAVDHPANAHCKWTIMKRRDDKETDNMRSQDIFAKTMSRPRGYATFEEACAGIAKAENCKAHEAMSRARTSYPHLYWSYQAEGDDAFAKHKSAEAAEAQRLAKIAEADAERNLEIETFARRHGCTRCEAARRLRRKHFGDAA